MTMLLIAPASGCWHHVGKRKYFNGKTFGFSLLRLLAVAAESSPDVNLRIIDCDWPHYDFHHAVFQPCKLE